jgi:hypothetical protein
MAMLVYQRVTGCFWSQLNYQPALHWVLYSSALIATAVAAAPAIRWKRSHIELRKWACVLIG